MHAWSLPRRRGRILLATLLAAVPFSTAAASVSDARAAAASQALAIPFAANHSQFDRRVAFSAATPGETVFVTRDGRIVHSLSGWTVVESFSGGRPNVQPGPFAPTRISRFAGGDPAGSARAEATYESVSLGAVWPGVRVSVKAGPRDFEKIFRVAAGATADAVAVRLHGASALHVATDGSLVADTGMGAIVFSAPIAYQEDGLGHRTPVEAKYRVRGRQYGFRLGPHDPAREVVIDPVVRTTFVGGSGDDGANSLTVNPSTGDLYLAGRTVSTDFPGTLGGAQASNAGFTDAFVARLSGDLKTLHQVTYLGGTLNEYARRVVFHSGTGEVIVMGPTGSGDFPGTSGGAQTSNAGSAYWVARLSADLTTLKQSTYFGGNGDSGGLVSGALAVDAATNDILIAGDSSATNLPGTASAAQKSSGGDFDAFVARFSSDLKTLQAATYFGGSGREAAFGLVVEPASHDVLVAGYTQSSNLPGTTSGALASSAGGQDAFVARFDKNLATIVQASYLGGTGTDTATSLVLRASGSLLVAGGTTSPDFPHTTGGAQTSRRGGSDAFVADLNPNLQSILSATYLGGGFDESAQAIAIPFPGSATSDIYVVGNTTSYDFPGVSGSIQSAAHASDLFLSHLSHDLSILVMSTYLGGRSADFAADVLFDPSSGEVLVAGTTSSASLPATLGSAQPTPGGQEGVSAPAVGDAFVMRLSPGLTPASAGSWTPASFVADPDASATSDGNQVFEPGETVDLAPFWKNATAFTFSQTGAATSFTGPSGPTYSAGDASAGYASTGGGATVNCASTANCYRFGVGSAPRPATHWDASFVETLSGGDVKTWALHIGDSFADVPRSQAFYKKIEAILHAGVTSGCTPTLYCPAQAVPRDQMAIFLAKVIAGGGVNVPVTGQVNGRDYRCNGGLSGESVFTDVSPSDPACKHIHYIAAQNVTLGCSATQFCPNDLVSRDGMAAFIAKSYVAPNGGSSIPAIYGPDPVTGLSYSCDVHAPNTHFSDVPVADPFCKFVHYLWARGFVGGCSATAYCPTGLVARDAMAKFLVNTFDLKLYGP